MHVIIRKKRIPFEQRTVLKIDDEAQAKCHDGEIAQGTKSDLKLLVHSK